MDERIVIPISKTKIFRLLLVSVVFVLLCVWLVLHSEADMSKKWIFACGALFFGLGICVFVKKIAGTAEGLIIDRYGITDNMTKPRVGTLRWEDIQHVEIDRLMNNKMLLLFVRNPEEYLEKIEPLKRLGLENNHRMAGTPFVIPSSMLKMPLEDIKDLINEQLGKMHRASDVSAAFSEDIRRQFP